MLNTIETQIQGLKRGQAIFLGHSAVIVNVAGVRIGFDIATLDGSMPSPFSNLIVGGTNTFSHLIPMVDTQSLIARPQVIAKFLDVIIYSHLHSDHFSLNYISIVKATNPNIRIVCPQNTKNYIKGISHFRNRIENNPIDKIRIFFFNKLFAKYTVSIDQLYDDIDQITSEEQEKVINSIEEISTLSSIKIPGKETDIIVSTFSTVHPAFQMYIQTPYELDPPPGVLGYKIAYREFDRDSTVMFVGEGASDPDTLMEIFFERDRLKMLFFPITEQIESKGSQFIQEFAAHSSIRTLAIVERIVSKGTKIVPLHQGLWYFQVTPTDIVKARKSLEKLGGNRFVHLPFVAISRVFKSINDQKNLRKTSDSQKVYVSRILATIRKRWGQYKKIARIVVKLPINGKVEGFPVGTVIRFSNTEDHDIESRDISKETLQVLIQAFLTEYQILHQEIDRAWEWQTQLIYYALFIIGGVITLINVFPDIQLLFIGASFILTMIGWTLIEKSIHMIRIGRYFLSDLIPRANQLLRDSEKIEVHDPKAEKIRVLLYEGYFRGGDIQTALQGFASLGRFSIAVVPGVAFAIAFFLIKQNAGEVWTLIEKVLFALATGLSTMPLITAILNGRFAFIGDSK